MLGSALIFGTSPMLQALRGSSAIHTQMLVSPTWLEVFTKL